MATIVTKDSAMSVEEIAWKFLLTLTPDDESHAAETLRTGFVEAVYTANPGLASMGQLIPIGTEIIMPEPSSELRVLPANRLWS